MSASERATQAGVAGSGDRRGDDNLHREAPGLSDFVGQGPDSVTSRQAEQQSARRDAAESQPEHSNSENNPNDPAQNSGERQEDVESPRHAVIPARPESESEGVESDMEEPEGEGEASDCESEGVYETMGESSSSDDLEKGGEAPTEEEELPHGCEHYRRKCKIVSPCCKRVFWCRHCHNEEANTNEQDPQKAHEINRHAVEEVVCVVCETQQPVSNRCNKCNTVFGNYFCEICKFWDDKGIKKGVYHCDECGICRSGGRERFFHCKTCGSCYPLELYNNHKCIENAMHQACPLCLEDMFASLRQSQVLRCGHTLHSDCLRSMMKQRGLQGMRCPLCCKSIGDYSDYWKRLSEQIEMQPIDESQRRKIQIICNDCNKRSMAEYHHIGLKCPLCNSFNTRDTD